MKCTIPEISWHNRDPVLSVDIQPIHLQKNELLYRVASGGTDTHVLVTNIKSKRFSLENFKTASLFFQ